MRTGMRRANKNEATRRALLDAARAVFVERGFHATSLDAVADAAGLTKGAVYSRFDSKADLFLALLDERIDDRTARIRSVVATGAMEGDVGALNRQWVEILRSELEWTLLVLEFRIHVARNPALNRRYAQAHRRFKRGLSEALAASLDAAGVTPGRPGDEIVDAMLAIASGAALERAADPDAFPLEVLQRLGLDLLAPVGHREKA